LPREPNDHTPILWESGQEQDRRKPRFKFEKWWLKHAGFRDLVEKCWNNPVEGNSAVDRWQNKVRLFRKKVKCWSANVEANLRRKKDKLWSKYEELDIRVESMILTNR
jgi:hypothetical protein